MNDVLIIEDHPWVADSTREIILGKYPTLSVTVCASADTALAALNEPSKVWHRILLDVGVPGAYGMSLGKKIQALGLGAITCVVTGFDRHPELVAQARALGFLGYIVKSSPREQQAMELLKVFSGERVFPSTAAAGKGEPQQLTRKQLVVLDYVRQGYSSKRIAAELDLKEGTINNHIDNAVGALLANSRTHAVAKAIELGLLGLESTAVG